MWLMARELQGNHVGLLVPCPSSAANKNKVRPLLFHDQRSVCDPAVTKRSVKSTLRVNCSMVFFMPTPSFVHT